MCLSTVYKDKKSEENALVQYVEKIEVKGDEIIFTDVLGMETRVKGHLKLVDLNGGGVIFSAA